MISLGKLRPRFQAFYSRPRQLLQTSQGLRSRRWVLRHPSVITGNGERTELTVTWTSPFPSPDLSFRFCRRRGGYLVSEGPSSLNSLNFTPESLVHSGGITDLRETVGLIPCSPHLALIIYNIQLIPVTVDSVFANSLTH